MSCEHGMFGALFRISLSHLSHIDIFIHVNWTSSFPILGFVGVIMFIHVSKIEDPD